MTFISIFKSSVSILCQLMKTLMMMTGTLIDFSTKLKPPKPQTLWSEALKDGYCT